MTNEPCTVRAEHGDCGAHPTKCLCDGGAYGVRARPFLVHPECPIHRAHPASEPNPWTDEDVDVVADALHTAACVRGCKREAGEHDRQHARDVLAALAPRLVERERAAAAKALRDAAQQCETAACMNLSGSWVAGSLRGQADEIDWGER